MGGKLDVTSRLGVGTTMIISVPLDVIVANSTERSLHMERSPRGITERNISTELAQMIPERSAAASTSVSVMDFETTVNSTQESLRNAPPSARPLRPSLARQASERADEEALVVDVAKLTFSNAVTTPNGTAVPMQDPLQPASPVSPAADGQKKPEPEQPNFRVLIAEDNPISRNILIKLLTGKVSQYSGSRLDQRTDGGCSGQGIPFSAAEDGQEALELFAAGNGSFNLFLADVQMPRLGGIAASKAMRKLEAERGWPRCHIIALTGLSNEADMQKTVGKEGPFDSWLVKGGKSLRAILDTVYTLQDALDAR